MQLNGSAIGYSLQFIHLGFLFGNKTRSSVNLIDNPVVRLSSPCTVWYNAVISLISESD